MSALAESNVCPTPLRLDREKERVVRAIVNWREGRRGRGEVGEREREVEGEWKSKRGGRGRWKREGRGSEVEERGIEGNGGDSDVREDQTRRGSEGVKCKTAGSTWYNRHTCPLAVINCLNAQQ